MYLGFLEVATHLLLFVRGVYPAGAGRDHSHNSNLHNNCAAAAQHCSLAALQRSRSSVCVVVYNLGTCSSAIIRHPALRSSSAEPPSNAVARVLPLSRSPL